MCHITACAFVEKDAIAWTHHGIRGANTIILTLSLLDPIIFAKLMVTLSVEEIPLENIHAQTRTVQARSCVRRGACCCHLLGPHARRALGGHRGNPSTHTSKQGPEAELKKHMLRGEPIYTRLRSSGTSHV